MADVPSEFGQKGRPAEPEFFSRRKSTMREVRYAREKLTSSTGLVRADDYELLRTYAQQRVSTAIAVLVLAAAIAGLATFWISPVYALIWFCVMLIPIIGVQTLCHRFLNVSPDTVAVPKWRMALVIAQFIEGFCWATILVLLSFSDGQSALIFGLTSLLMAGALTVMLTATLPRAVYAGLFPIACGIALMLWGRRESEMMSMAGMALAAQFFFMLIANRLYTGAVTNITHRAEKDALIAELETAKANSDEARRKAEDANLAKSRFLATMSHELRTPLNAIMGFSEVMKSEVFGGHAHPSYKEYSADIHASGQHLLNLINEILDLSRIEAGKYELNEEPITLVHIVEECRHMMNLRANAKEQRIKEVMEPGLPKIWADERAVRQIVLNVLSNAIKFTPQGGDIIVKVGWTASGGQYVTVVDTGPGIPEDEIPTVLSSFGRGSLAIKTAEQGSGLGLPIVKGLVDLHGGGFQLKSKPRVGTEVTVTFPTERVLETLPAVGEDAKPRRRAAA